MAAQEWVDDLREAIRTFSDERKRTPVVRVTFADGVARYVERVAVGANDRLLTLNIYPDVENVLESMVKVERIGLPGADHFTREVIVTEAERIVQVELLYDRPQGRQNLGFVVPPAEPAEP